MSASAWYWSVTIQVFGPGNFCCYHVFLEIQLSQGDIWAKWASSYDRLGHILS